MVFTPTDERSTDAARARLVRFKANGEALKRAWPRLLLEHDGEWVAVFGAGQVVLAPSMLQLSAMIPNDQAGSAVVRLISQDEHARLL
jgi:hypothetical protein